MRQPARWLIVTTAGAITAVLLTAVVALGADAIPTKDSGSDITSVKAKGVTGSNATDATAWVQPQSASIDITVSGEDALLVARFSGESKCDRPGTGFASSPCYLRIVVDDGITETPMNPSSEIAFDSSVGCVASAGDTCDAFTGWASHAVQTFLRVDPGNYTVRVQYRVDNTDVDFTLRDYTLTVERIV